MHRAPAGTKESPISMDTMPKMSPATPLCPGILSKLEKALIEKINDMMVKITNKIRLPSALPKLPPIPAMIANRAGTN